MYHKISLKIYFNLITISFILITFQACNKADNTNPVAPITYVRGEIVNQLPATFSALMNSTFISDYVNGNEQNVCVAVQENTFLNWVPQTPIHFFHGDADEVVPLQNALTAVNIFTSSGVTNIQLTIIPGGTHETSVPPAVIGTIQWFESM
jgi:pimeloyl-ACP methyl ester carboxylesterase